MMAISASFTISLHDALPIYGAAGPLGGAGAPAGARGRHGAPRRRAARRPIGQRGGTGPRPDRSEEHTSELQSHSDLVCRLLLEKKTSTVNVTTKLAMITEVI